VGLLRFRFTLRQVMLVVAMSALICAINIKLVPAYPFDGHTYMEFGGLRLDSSSPIFWAVQLAELAIAFAFLTLLVLVVLYVGRAAFGWRSRSD
jgi:hypothetical protein